MKSIASKILIAVMLGAAILPVPPAFAAEPEGIRLSWQNDPRTAITIMWRAENENTPALAEYGASRALGSSASGISFPAVLPNSWYKLVEITGLAPDTQYFFRVHGDNNSWSEIYDFRTAPAGPKSFRFTVFGDNGMLANTGERAITIKDLTARENPAFHLIAGDLSYADKCGGGLCSREHWEEWFSEMQRISARAPTMPAIGNHETYDEVKFENGELFWNRSLALPPENNELFYSFDYGDAHFMIVNSDDKRSLHGGEQYEWLRADLSRTNKKWKIAVMHHPIYSNGRHGADKHLQRWLAPLFDEFDVDLALTGHDHFYERTYPLRIDGEWMQNQPTIASSLRNRYENVDGTVYVVTGGGGRGVYEPGSNFPFSASQCKCNQFMKIDVSENELRAVSIGLDGSTIDEFAIVKTTAPAAGGGEPPAQNRGFAAPRGAAAKMKFRGFNFPSWWHDTYLKEDTRAALRAAKETGANWVAIDPFWYQEGRTSTRIRPHSSGNKTATEESVRNIIRYARQIGFKVALKPMVDAEDDTWRGEFEPHDPAVWFASYRDFILPFARMAQEEGVELFIAGTELRNLTKPEHDGRWRALIREIRERYSGAVTYNANWHGEYDHVSFWNALDAIAVSAYFRLAATDDASRETMEARWRNEWLAQIKNVRDRSGKPVIFTEIGYQSRNGSAITPWRTDGVLDMEEQARAYEAAVNFWKDAPWMQGMFFWHWSTNNSHRGTSDLNFTPRGKPAEDVLRHYWIAENAQSPAAGPAAEPQNPAHRPQTAVSDGANQPPYAYGLARRPLVIERRAAKELARELKTIFRGNIPLQARFWPIYVNAYLYGHYPIKVIARAIPIGGKVVHPAIPWSAWRRHPIYLESCENCE